MKKLLLFTFLIITSITHAQTIDEFMDSADSLGQLGQLEAAAIITNQQLEVDSNCVRCHITLGKIYHNQSKYNKAAFHYRKALNIGCDLSIALFLADAEYALENMDKYCEVSANVIPVYEENYNLLEEKQKSNINSRKATYLEVCDSTKDTYYFHRGIAAQNIGDSANTIYYYNKGLEKFPNSALIKNYRGNYNTLVGGDFETAIEDYKFTLSHQNELIEYLFTNFNNNDSTDIIIFIAQTKANMALAYYNNGDYENAEITVLGALEDVFDLKGKDVAISKAIFTNLYGEILIQLLKFEAAKQKFEEALVLQPKFSTPYKNIAYLIFLENTLNTAQEKYMNLGFSNELLSFNKKIDFSKVKFKSDDMDKDTAIYLINKYLKLEPEDAYAYCLRGDLKRLQNQVDYCLDYHTALQKGMVELKPLIENLCD